MRSLVEGFQAALPRLVLVVVMMVHGCCWSCLVETLPPFPRAENIPFRDFCFAIQKKISFDMFVYTGGTVAKAAQTAATPKHSTKVL